jgi:hypothetical protein
MVFHTSPPRYRAFMLRCWEVRGRDPLGPTAWQFSLEDPHSGTRRGFANLDALMAFLRRDVVGEDQEADDNR